MSPYVSLSAVENNAIEVSLEDGLTLLEDHMLELPWQMVASQQ